MTTKLSLSQAMRLGAMLCAQSFGMSLGYNDSRCALASVALSVGVDAEIFGEILIRLRPLFPILDVPTECPAGHGHRSLHAAILCLNDKQHWTREQIADFIHTIEAQQPAIDREHATPAVPEMEVASV